MTVKKNISIIPANPEYDRTTRYQYKRLRVGAYCRVSTLQEQQETSYEAQVRYYTEKINSNPDWTFAGIYADDGKSATMIRKRDDFQAMIDDCMAGKIDMIITKSISRFARNTVDSLTNIRKLKEKNIAIYFEKEGINTLGDGGEMLITILSSQAQEESRNLSENVHWGYVRQFEKGIVYVNHKKFLGYTKDEDGNLVIVPKEAELVRRIFRLYLEGFSISKIAELLTQEGIPTVTGKKIWCPSVIERMLVNEKYMGDALLQKTYTVDFLSKKRVKNNGIVPQYYIEGNHEAIIPRELFYKVQEEKARRAAAYREEKEQQPPEPKGRKTRLAKPVARGKYSSQYVLSDIMICQECGQMYRRQVWKNNEVKKPVWRCNSRLKSGTKRCKHSPTLEEKVLHGAIMEAINSVVENDGEFVDAFRENVIRILGSYAVHAEPTEYEEQIDGLQKQMLSLIEDSAKAECADEEFDKAYREIADQIKELKKKRTKLIREKQLAEAYEERVEGVGTYVKKTNYLKRQFDDALVRRLIKIIKVISSDKIEIQFHSGIVMTQKIDYYD